jgi:hypothetical protein
MARELPDWVDSNGAVNTDDGQTISKTEVGQTMSSNHKHARFPGKSESP